MEPDDPITELRQGAAMLHEMFMEYITAGFSEQQALYLCGKLLTAGVGGGQE